APYAAQVPRLRRRQSRFHPGPRLSPASTVAWGATLRTGSDPNDVTGCYVIASTGGTSFAAGVAPQATVEWASGLGGRQGKGEEWAPTSSRLPGLTTARPFPAQLKGFPRPPRLPGVLPRLVRSV